MIEVLEKEWLLETAISNEECNALLKDLVSNGLISSNISENAKRILVEMLISRGIKSAPEAKKFFEPSLNDLHDPFLMKDMKEAVDRIEVAVQKKERIMIIGDYDVDGTTATAVALLCLKSLGANVEYYIPDRFTEGYGVSEKSILYASENGVGLIISLDCGIKANRMVAMASDKNIDFIVCDHHNPGEEIPPAFAVLDPKRDDCNYPYDSLSGCGVGYKLMQALSEQLTGKKSHLVEYLSFVATSIAADIVPMTGENRILTHYGLQEINKRPPVGIAAIKEIAGAKKAYEVSDLVFRIAPRINSAGRMSSGRDAVELLIATSPEGVSLKMDKITGFNNERRDTDKHTTEMALELIDQDEDYHSKKTTVLYHPEWNKGVIGIVASRLIERYYRPTIVLTESDGKISGSARSVRNFDLYSALEKCEHLLLQFGGHKYAAGMVMEKDNLEAFRKKFDEVVGSMLLDEHLRPALEIDKTIFLSDISPAFYEQLMKFAPFGPANMKPLFLSKSVVIKNCRMLTGNYAGSHLKLKLGNAENDKLNFDAIGFGMGERIDEIAEGSLIDIVYQIEENDFNGRVTLQLLLKDFKTC